MTVLPNVRAHQHGAFDKGGEFEPEVLKCFRFGMLRACTEKMAANTVFSDFEGNGLNFVKNWLQKTGMEKRFASYEGMYYKIV
jgi:hypothetical protein